MGIKKSPLRDTLDILIVEDSPTQAEQLKYLLEQHHYSVTAANSGQQALALMDKHKPALVISDIVMPEMNGFELCQQIKSNESTQDIPVILLTGLSSSEDVLEGLACGADNFITKPYSEEYLLLHVEHILANRKLRENERVRVGVEILFAGKSRFITANQQQMLTLLLSTYEAAVHRNTELIQAQDELRSLNERLEDIVEERTAALSAEIAERKRAEARVRRLSRVYAVLSDTNQAIVRVRELQALFETACRIAVEKGGFRMAWIGLLDLQTKEVRPAAHAGETDGYLEKLRIVLDDSSHGRGPTASALRASQHVIVNDIEQDPRMAPWREDSLRREYRSSAAFPLKVNGETRGIINLYASEPDFFDEEEIKLLDELALDISFAMEFAEKEADRRRAEAALHVLAARQEALLAAIPDIIMEVDNNKVYTWANQAGIEFFGEDVIGKEAAFYFEGEQDTYAVVQPLFNGNESTIYVESWQRRKDGQKRLLAWWCRVLKDDRGNAIGALSSARDITESKRVEVALRESEERFRSLYENSTVGLYRTTPDGRILLANPTLVRILGYSSFDELVTRELEKHGFEPSYDRAQFLERIERDGEVKGLESGWTRRDGTAIFVRESARAIRDLQGKTLHYDGTVEDITERKQAEEALGRRAAQLALINKMGSQIAAVLELEGLLDRAAHLVQESFGYHHVALFTLDREQGVLVMRATAGDFAHLFPSDHRLKLGQGMVGWAGQHGQTLLANDVDAEPHYVNLYPGIMPTRSELSVPIRVGGEVVGVLDIQSPQANAFDENDVKVKETLADQIAVAIENARLYEAVQRELAERRRVEEEIRRRNRELTLLNHIIAASATGAEPETILEVACRELAQAFDVPHATACILNNEKTAALVVAEYSSAGPGQRRAEGWPSALNTTIFVGDNPTLQHLLTRKTPLVVTGTRSDRDLASLHEAMNEREVVSLLSLPLVIKGEVVGSLSLDDSEPHPFPAEEVSLAWSVADQVSGTLARARVDQERQHLEEQYHQAQKMEAVGQLTAGIAHDFNNLLTAINGFAELMQFELSPDDPLQKSLSKILDSGQHAADLIRRLLAFSRKQILEPKVLDLNQVVAETDMMLRRIIGEHINMETSMAPDLWPVEVDPAQIGQVIVNLAVNAQDAMPRGGSLTIETANVVLDEDYVADHLEAEPGEYVLLAVSDTGIGMSQEVKAHIFEPFFTTKERGRGTGLGLATVYGIVKQSGGHIWVYSEEEVGTTFKIYLPRAEGTVRPLTRPEMREPMPGGEETILLVEDDAGVRDLARRVLQSQGYTLLEAENGQEALRLVARHPGIIHLLLTDMVMPGMSGRDLAEQLAQAHPNLKTLFMSGYADDMIAHHGVLDPGTPFLQKPFGPMALARKVRAVLDS